MSKLAALAPLLLIVSVFTIRPDAAAPNTLEELFAKHNEISVFSADFECDVAIVTISYGPTGDALREYSSTGQLTLSNSTGTLSYHEKELSPTGSTNNTVYAESASHLLHSGSPFVANIVEKESSPERSSEIGRFRRVLVQDPRNIVMDPPLSISLVTLAKLGYILTPEAGTGELRVLHPTKQDKWTYLLTVDANSGYLTSSASFDAEGHLQAVRTLQWAGELGGTPAIAEEKGYTQDGKPDYTRVIRYSGFRLTEPLHFSAIKESLLASMATLDRASLYLTKNDKTEQFAYFRGLWTPVSEMMDTLSTTWETDIQERKRSYLWAKWRTPVQLGVAGILFFLAIWTFSRRKKQ